MRIASMVDGYHYQKWLYRSPCSPGDTHSIRPTILIKRGHKEYMGKVQIGLLLQIRLKLASITLIYNTS